MVSGIIMADSGMLVNKSYRLLQPALAQSHSYQGSMITQASRIKHRPYALYHFVLFQSGYSMDYLPLAHAHGSGQGTERLSDQRKIYLRKVKQRPITAIDIHASYINLSKS